jgi:pyrimidine operon attenuation protein/uracil phosphoribosyltransferase
MTENNSGVLLMDAAAIERAMKRIAHEIVEQNPDLSQIVLAGIPLRGVELAHRLAAHITSFEGQPIETGIVDVTMHRDDTHLRGPLPTPQLTILPLDLNERTIILIDDVLYTGRTCRAALDSISSYGRPARIQLATLLDRGHRELPIRPDYVGKNVPSSRNERVMVRLTNVDPEGDSVWLRKN